MPSSSSRLTYLATDSLPRRRDIQPSHSGPAAKRDSNRGHDSHGYKTEQASRVDAAVQTRFADRSIHSDQSRAAPPFGVFRIRASWPGDGALLPATSDPCELPISPPKPALQKGRPTPSCTT